MVLRHFQIFPIQVKQILHLHQPADAEQCGNALRDSRRKRHAIYSHTEIYDKYQIQDDIQDTSHDQIDQRRDGIAQSPQDAAQDIVVSKPRRPDKENMEIRGTPVNDAVRCLQKQKQGPCQHRSHHHDKYGRQSSQYDTVSNRAGQILPVLCAEILRHHDACAHTDPDKQHDQQIQDGPRAPYRGQRVVAYKVADHHAVYRIIKLLRNIPDQHGNRKYQYIFPWLSHCHVNRSK